MKPLADKLFLMTAAFFLIGCAGVQLIEDRKDFPRTSTIEDYSYTIYIPYVRYVATPLDMNSFCNKKEWKDIYVSGDVLGGLVSFVTVGIVHPQRAEVTCLD